MIRATEIAEQYYLNPEAAEAVALIVRYSVDQMIPEEYIKTFVHDVEAAQGLTHTNAYRHKAICSADLGALIRHHEDEIKDFIDNGEPLSQETYDIFFEHFTSSGAMPYGTIKARTGDPGEFIFDRISERWHERIQNGD